MRGDDGVDPLLRLWPSMNTDLQTRLLGAHQRHGKLSVKKVIGTLRGSSPAIAQTLATIGESSEVVGKSDSSAPALASAAGRVATDKVKFKCSQYVSRTCELLLECGTGKKVSCEDFFLQLVGSGPSPLLLQWQEDGFDAQTIRSIYHQKSGHSAVLPHSPHPSHPPCPSRAASEMTQQVKDVFISYGREGPTLVFVHGLKAGLERAGYSVWLDTEAIPSGSQWHAVIGEGLRQCKALVAVITHKYARSRFCKNELFMADSAHKDIFPVFLEDVDFSSEDAGVLYTISSINWIKVKSGRGGHREALEALIRGLRDKAIVPSWPEGDNQTDSHSVTPQDAAQCSKPLNRFSVEEVCSFVSGMELDAQPFRENSVAGEDLLELTEEDLRGELGLKPLQVRKLQKKIRHKLQQESMVD